MSLVEPSVIWIVILGFLVAAALSFGIGGNGVAISFATSVGSKALTIKQACILATVFEILGVVMMGAKSSDTLRQGVISFATDTNHSLDNSREYKLLMVGQLSSLTGSCAWLLIASFIGLPISATHSIVGATVGFALVAKGINGVNWWKIVFVVASWFVSPVLSGCASILLFIAVQKLILDKVDDRIEPGLRVLPMTYGFIIVISGFSIFHDGTETLAFDEIPLWGVFILSFGLGTIVVIVMKLLFIPAERIRISQGDESEKQPLQPVTVNYTEGTVLPASLERMKTQSKDASENDPPSYSFKTSKESLISASTEKSQEENEIEEFPEHKKLFSNVQVVAAVFAAFTHGGNDVSNSIAPLIGMWLSATHKTVSTPSSPPLWILLYGGVWISVGFWVLGRRVIETVGQGLTKLTSSSGSCIELGVATTVLVATNVGLPVSSTHCRVGSVVAVGRFRPQGRVNWNLFRNILLAWLVTLPVSGAISGVVMFGLKHTV